MYHSTLGLRVIKKKKKLAVEGVDEVVVRGRVCVDVFMVRNLGGGGGGLHVGDRLMSSGVPRGEKILYSGIDPESYITEYTLVYEEFTVTVPGRETHTSRTRLRPFPQTPHAVCMEAHNLRWLPRCLIGRFYRLRVPRCLLDCVASLCQWLQCQADGSNVYRVLRA